MGIECYKIYKNLPLTDEERKFPEIILEKLTAEFQAKRNVVYKRYVFNSCVQETSETFDRFLNRLRERAATCKFAALESEMLRDRTVIGINNNITRERLLREKDLTLGYAINICKTSEMAVRQPKKNQTPSQLHFSLIPEPPAALCP
mgnify:CR=1 FL=1